MTRILKRDQNIHATAVRSLQAWPFETDAASKATPPVDPEWVRLSEERDALRRRLEDCEAELERVIARQDATVIAAETRGRKAGLKEAEDRSAALSAQLGAALHQALALFERDLGSLERLAPALAREGLEAVVGRSEARAELVADIIRRQLSALATDAVVRIDVARADFADSSTLEAFAAARGAARTEIHATDELGSGDCRIKLVLGGLEVGVDQQWSRLAALLAEMAEPAALRP